MIYTFLKKNHTERYNFFDRELVLSKQLCITSANHKLKSVYFGLLRLNGNRDFCQLYETKKYIIWYLILMERTPVLIK
jgi:hypothetical protein